jgi:hypothetical protein
MMKTKLFSVVLLSLAMSAAIAGDGDHDRDNGGGHWIAAPEIDPGQAISALMLLSGTVAVLRGRRNRKR